jgi:hypothetical protein
LLEAEVWSVTPVTPATSAGSIQPHRRMAYDAMRERTVMVMDGFVWAWDGTTWTFLASDAPAEESRVHDVVFDSTRGTLLVISGSLIPTSVDPLVTRDTLSEWDGTGWTTAPLSNPPSLDVFASRMVYDPARDRVLAVGVNGTAGQLWSLDVAARAWTQHAAPPGITQNTLALDAAFDRARNVMVVIRPSPTPATLEWNGTSWTSVATIPPGQGSWSLGYDGAQNRVFSAGGAAVADVSLYATWNGTTWTARATSPGRRESPGVAYDARRGRLVVFGGSWPNRLIEWNGSAWLIPSLGPDSAYARCALDSIRGRMLCVQSGGGGTVEWWAHDGTTWSPAQPPATQVDPEVTLTYDPSRAGTVVIRGDQLHVLGDTAWSTTAIAPGLDPIGSLMFDPGSQRLVAATSDGSGYGDVVAIDSTGAWTQLRDTSSLVTSLSYDALNRALVAVDATGVFENTGTGWAMIVAPASAMVVENQRRGTLEFIGSDIWERQRQTYIRKSPLPVTIIGAATYDARRGALVVYGSTAAGSQLLMTRTYASETPLETCEPATDSDGDGLEHCSDPDCWLDCTPTCPPYATCP